jgi:integrase
LPDGTLGSETGFATKTAAQERAKDIDSDQRRGTFVDPRLGQTTLREWVAQWEEAHDVSAGTWAKYRSHLRNHILPKFGDTGLAAITRITVKAWVKALRRNLAERTVADIVFLLSTLMSEAIDEGLIGNNPCRKLRINVGEHTERATLTATQVGMLAQHAAENSLLIVTAAYTGMRWGELAGLQWHNVDLDKATITIDPDKGALHEVHGHLELGPPKTMASVRTVHLPPFLVTALTAHQDTQQPRARVHRNRRWTTAALELPPTPLATRPGPSRTARHSHPSTDRRSPRGMDRQPGSRSHPNAAKHGGGCHPDQRQRRGRHPLSRSTAHPQDLDDRRRCARSGSVPTVGAQTGWHSRCLLARHAADD